MIGSHTAKRGKYQRNSENQRNSEKKSTAVETKFKISDYLESVSYPLRDLQQWLSAHQHSAIILLLSCNPSSSRRLHILHAVTLSRRFCLI